MQLLGRRSRDPIGLAKAKREITGHEATDVFSRGGKALCRAQGRDAGRELGRVRAVDTRATRGRNLALRDALDEPIGE